VSLPHFMDLRFAFCKFTLHHNLSILYEYGQVFNLTPPLKACILVDIMYNIGRSVLHFVLENICVLQTACMFEG
jgi:hypothetical protein